MRFFGMVFVTLAAIACLAGGAKAEGFDDVPCSFFTDYVNTEDMEKRAVSSVSYSKLTALYFVMGAVMEKAKITKIEEADPEKTDKYYFAIRDACKKSPESRLVDVALTTLASSTVDTPLPTSRPADAPEPVEEVSASEVFDRVSDRYTEVQRTAYFDSVEGARISFRGRVNEVKKGWLGGYTVVLDGSRDQTVYCRLADGQEKAAIALRPRQAASCVGLLDSYAKILGTTVLYVDDGRL